MTFMRWMILVLTVVALVAGLGFAKYSQVTAAIEIAESYPEHAESVEAVTAKLSLYQPETHVPGEVVVPEYVVIKSQHAGQVSRVGFLPGEAVTRGQLLMQLDISVEQAQLKGARAEAFLAGKDLSRAENLFKKGSMSKARLDKIRADADITESRLQIIQTTIAQKTVRAPFAGLTRPGNLRRGEYVQQGQTIASITGSRDKIWLDFRLPPFLQPRLLKELPFRPK